MAVSMDEFSRMLEYLLEVNSIDVIEGKFNYDLSKVFSNKLLGYMIEYTHVANETRHISGSQIDHVYKSALLEEFYIKAIVQNIYFSDHDAVRIILQKREVDFTFSK